MLIIIKTKQKGRPITKENYLFEITDLLGIRVLYVFKEDYYPVHLQIWNAYESRMAKDMEIKLQPGDDEKNANGPRLEIQTRTIFEEGWSEINHKLVYKNRDMSDYFSLVQASKILSSLVGNCDTLGTLMKTIHDEYIKKLNENAIETNTEQSSIIMGEVLQRFLMK